MLGDPARGTVPVAVWARNHLPDIPNLERAMILDIDMLISGNEGDTAKIRAYR
jgi:hypothetical protein